MVTCTSVCVCMCVCVFVRVCVCGRREREDSTELPFFSSCRRECLPGFCCKQYSTATYYIHIWCPIRHTLSDYADCSLPNSHRNHLFCIHHIIHDVSSHFAHFVYILQTSLGLQIKTLNSIPHIFSNTCTVLALPTKIPTLAKNIHTLMFPC